MINLPLDGGFYESDSLPISAQQAINLFVNQPQTANALSQSTLFGSAGLNQLATTGATPDQVNRGAHVKDGKPYFVNDSNLVRLDRTVDGDGNETFALVTLGTITGTGRVSMADNGTQLMIVADNKGWIMDESAGTPFQQITDPDFTTNGNPKIVKFMRGYFFVSTDADKVINSAINDGLSYNALDFISAESDPDGIVTIEVFKNQLYVGGDQTFEVFEVTGVTGGSPLQPITGFSINKGVSASFSINQTTDGIIFLGGGENETPAIWLLSGASVQKLSTTAIDSIIGSYSIDDIDNAFITTYAQNGAYFIVISFPKNTFEFNTITGKWNERESRYVDARGVTVNARWRINSLVSAYNRIICGDNIDGRIGEVSRDYYQEYGSEIVRTLTTAPFNNQGLSFSISKLELTVESGVADADALAEPQVRLSVSKDGGKTFNNEISRGFGKIGEYFRRVIWRRLGRFSRFSVLKFEMSEAVKPVIIKLEAQIRGGNGN